ncbi:hypothetical protein [Microbacterium sp. ZXX196]|uniref:hypothetical protein n=1 Tax=Microbacterium sp. ZXX196 TaxID=2609291 RepID=UPI0012B8CF47|nr:hypothetical protein [Microbacterium sp. ZXX196]MTE24659.1 hypothetical protein [Microbacterium sp. ZXX196]
MAATIFVNLPVADVERTKAFYAALGAEIVPGFSDDSSSTNSTPTGTKPTSAPARLRLSDFSAIEPTL